MKLEMHKILILTSVACAYGVQNEENLVTSSIEDTSAVVEKVCDDAILSTICLKYGAIKLLEKLNEDKEIQLLPGLTLIKDRHNSKTDLISKKFIRSFTSKSEEKLDKILLYYLGMFLNTHSLKMKLVDGSSVEQVKNIVEERSKKQKGAWAWIIAMGVMMKDVSMEIYSQVKHAIGVIFIDKVEFNKFLRRQFKRFRKIPHRISSLLL